MLMESVKEHKAAGEGLLATGPALSKEALQRSGQTKAGAAARRRAAARHQDSSAYDEVITLQMHMASTGSDCEDTCSCWSPVLLPEVIMSSMIQSPSVNYESVRSVRVGFQDF